MGIRKSYYRNQQIPTRFIFDGDEEAGRKLVGFAKQQFARRLEIDGGNRYNKHLTKNRKWQTIESNLGELIDMQMIGGVSFIRIYVPFTDSEEGAEEKRIFCYCDCGVTAGIMEESPARYHDPHDEWRPTNIVEYKALLCDETERVEREVQCLDWFAHRDGEPDDNDIDTRSPDNVYAVIGEDDIVVINENEEEELQHIRLPYISACDWEKLFLLSIEPTYTHLLTEEIITDGG